MEGKELGLPLAPGLQDGILSCSHACCTTAPALVHFKHVPSATTALDTAASSTERTCTEAWGASLVGSFSASGQMREQDEEPADSREGRALSFSSVSSRMTGVYFSALSFIETSHRERALHPCSWPRLSSSEEAEEHCPFERLFLQTVLAGVCH